MRRIANEDSAQLRLRRTDAVALLQDRQRRQDEEEGVGRRVRHHAELWTTLNSPAAPADEPPKQRRKTKERTVPAG